MQIKYLTDGLFTQSEWVTVEAFSSLTKNYFIVAGETLKVIPEEFVTMQYFTKGNDDVLDLMDFLELRLGELNLNEQPDFSLVEIRDKQVKTSH